MNDREDGPRDVTPEGDEIRTITMWLPFTDGEAAISLDATKFVAGLKRAEEVTQRVAQRLQAEWCKCDHDRTKHLHVNLGGDGREYGRCTLCPCRLFRRVAK